MRCRSCAKGGDAGQRSAERDALKSRQEGFRDKKEHLMGMQIRNGEGEVEKRRLARTSVAGSSEDVVVPVTAKSSQSLKVVAFSQNQGLKPGDRGDHSTQGFQIVAFDIGFDQSHIYSWVTAHKSIDCGNGNRYRVSADVLQTTDCGASASKKRRCTIG